MTGSTNMRNSVGTTALEITLRNLHKQFDLVRAVNGVDLEVPGGAFLVLLGPSGCGKSTILRMIAGLEEPTSGQITLGHTLVSDGSRQFLAPARRNIGLVFQSYALWPHMSVRENIEWPLKIKRWDAEDRNRRVQEVLSLLDISQLAGRYPHQLSGGQQQRVAIARTIGPRPGVLLFDEPLSNLDTKLRAEMRSELLKVHKTSMATSVYVTHDQSEAMSMATHIAVINDGVVEQFGTPAELLSSPKTRFVASFVGTPPANLLRVRSKGGRLYYQTIDLGPHAAPTQNLLLMYRAESLSLRNNPDGSGRSIPVEFVEAMPMAGRKSATVWDGLQRINVITSTEYNYRFGDTLFLEFPQQPDAVFPLPD